MIITGLDFGLILSLSYMLGVGTGIIIIFKYKDNLLIKSRSNDNNLNTLDQGIPVITSTAPCPINPTVTKITLE